MKPNHTFMILSFSAEDTRETPCFHGLIIKDGMSVIEVFNDGHGGANEYEPVHHNGITYRDMHDMIKAYGESQLEIDTFTQIFTDPRCCKALDEVEATYN